VGEPQSELVIRGLERNSVEVIRMKVAMIRSILPSTNSKKCFKKIGSESKTFTAIIYMEKCSKRYVAKNY
jgi:hypothetical protein